METCGTGSIIEASSTLKGDRSEWTMDGKSPLCGGKSVVGGEGGGDERGGDREGERER